MGITTGWGITRAGAGSSLAERLQAVATPIVNNTVCNCSYNGVVTFDVICAGFPQSGRGICNADSGGPLVYRLSSGFLQIGIVSWSGCCASPGFPCVYARVPHFVRWIRTNMQ